MNLQLCAPYQPCVYHCGPCIAREHKHGYAFENLYHIDPAKYFQKLVDVIDECNISTVVLTGECDPTQDILWVIQCCQTIKELCKNTVRIEMQTHNFNLKPHQVPDEVDVLSYSLTSSKDYLSSWRYYKKPGMISRAVLLLTEDLSFLNKDNFSPMGFNQFTFKVLQPTESEESNKWIEEYRMRDLTNIYEIMESRNGGSVSVRVDTNCQTATGRYYIFRSDGNLYDSWESAKPVPLI